MFFIPIEQQTVDIGAWGNPTHGLVEFFYMDPAGVEDGFLDEDRTNITLLKDGITEQPYSFRKFVNRATANLLLTGASELLRSPAEEASDDARGFEWRNDIIFNGGSIYVRDLFLISQTAGASWPYVDSNGKVWRIILRDLFTNAAAQVYGPNTLDAFARFDDPFKFKFSNSLYNDPFTPDLPIEEFDHTFSTADAGITDIESFKSSQFVLSLMDYNQDGGKALLYVGDQNFAPLYPGWSTGDVDNPINFKKAVSELGGPRAIDVVYEMTITGVPGEAEGMNPLTIVVDVFKTQEECYGDIITNEYSRPNTKGFQSATYTNAFATDPNTIPFTRPDLIVDLPSRFANHTNIRLVFGISEEFKERCQIDEIDCAGVSLGTGGAANYPSQYFVSNFPFAGVSIREWEFTRSYAIDDRVRWNGQGYICIDAHVTDDDFEPGRGVDWRDKWVINWRDPTEASGAQPYTVWADDTLYRLAPLVSQNVLTTGVKTFTNVSVHTSSPETEPGVGEFGDIFWKEGGVEIAPGSPWEAGKIFTQNSMCTSIFVSPLDGAPELGTFICKVPEVQSAELTQPFIGSQWRKFWEPQYDQIPQNVGDWEDPVFYDAGDLVVEDLPPSPQFPLTPSLGNQPAVFSATSTHQSFDPSTNPNTAESPWEELWANCRIFGISQIWAHFAFGNGDEIADFVVENQFAWGHYKEDGTVKEYQVDVSYQLNKTDSDFSGCWQNIATPVEGDPEFPDGPSMNQGSGNEMQGDFIRNADYTESFSWKIRVEGSIRHEITIESTGVANGQDAWTEEYETLEKTWNPVGFNNRTVKINGVEVSDFTENFDENTPGVTKGEERDQDFVDGLTFEIMDSTYLDNFKDQMVNSLIGFNGTIPGGGMLRFDGGLVSLPAVGLNPNDHFSSRPLRTPEQVAKADPTPTIFFAIYSPQLVGGFMMARNQRPGPEDIFYQRVLEPSDFQWDQLGMYAPDAESNARTSLGTRQPLGTGIEVITNANYGDDISSCYDPRTKQIVRNSQKRVCFV